VSLVEPALLCLPQHLSSSAIFVGIRVPQSLALVLWFAYQCLSFVLFHLAIVLSVFLQFTTSDCPVDIPNLILRHVTSLLSVITNNEKGPILQLTVMEYLRDK
jgi:hypothetical protein